MRATIIVEFGWCQFGFATGLIPEVRAGLVRVAWCRGSIVEKLHHCQMALTECWNELQFQPAVKSRRG